MLRHFMLLLSLLALSQAAATGYNYGSFSNSGVTANQLEMSARKVEISKDIFSFAPPAAENEELSYLSDLPTTSRKHIKVIFIRYPEYPNLAKDLTKLIKTNAEQKTIIYVLEKQTDLSDLTQKLHEIKQNTPNKPEVRFVKYNTPEDAKIAVLNIKNHFTSLGGATQNHGSEIAPVVEFTSRSSR